MVCLKLAQPGKKLPANRVCRPVIPVYERHDVGVDADGHPRPVDPRPYVFQAGVANHALQRGLQLSKARVCIPVLPGIVQPGGFLCVYRHDFLP